jgi:uncharacterized protein (TIGR03067 family)
MSGPVFLEAQRMSLFPRPPCSIALLISLAYCHASSLAEERRDDTKPLQGNWKVVETLWAGRPVEMFQWNASFAADQVEFSDEAKVWSGRLKLHAAGDPEALDIQLDKQTISLRYRLRDDKLRLVLPNGLYGKRPKDFESVAKDYEKFVLTLERCKPPAAVAGDDVIAKTERTRRARLRAGGKLYRLGAAMWAYIEKQKTWPAAATVGKDGTPLLSWRVALLPYLGERELYDQFHQDEPWDSEHNLKLLPRMPAIYASEGNPPKSPHGTFFQVFVGENCTFERGKELGVADFPDGTSSAMGIVIAGRDVPWTKPEDIDYDKSKPLPSFVGGMFDDGLFSFSGLLGDVYLTSNLLDEKKESLLRRCITRNEGGVANLKELAEER